MTDTFEDVARSKYLILTTFTKDGRPKPTTVWGVYDDGKLLISTDDGCGRPSASTTRHG